MPNSKEWKGKKEEWVGPDFSGYNGQWKKQADLPEKREEMKKSTSDSQDQRSSEATHRRNLMQIRHLILKPMQYR